MRPHRQIPQLAVVLLALAGHALGQVTILQIRVVEGEGAVHPPGARSSRPVVVEVSDDAGRPVAGAAVAFHLPEDGPGGSFGNGLRTDVVMTDARGRAAGRGFQANRLPGRFQIRILVSKEQARAGSVSFQYIGELSSRSSTGVKGKRKWMVVAGGVAGGALAAAFVTRGGSPTPANPPAPPAPAAVTMIGTPTISVGKP